MSLVSLVEWNVSLGSADVSWGGGMRAIRMAAKETRLNVSLVKFNATFPWYNARGNPTRDCVCRSYLIRCCWMASFLFNDAVLRSRFSLVTLASLRLLADDGVYGSRRAFPWDLLWDWLFFVPGFFSRLFRLGRGSGAFNGSLPPDEIRSLSYSYRRWSTRFGGGWNVAGALTGSGKSDENVNGLRRRDLYSAESKKERIK